MNSRETERCTLIVSARDRFSTTEACLDNLSANTPELHDLIVVLGGAPEELRCRLESRYAGSARLIFTPHFLNGAQARNLGLREAKTRLSVCLDNDVFVRPDWLSPLIRCQQETGAGLVLPLILEEDLRIHTAACLLFITHKGGQPYASKVLSYHHQKVHDDTNLARVPADYGEMHCQLVETQAALGLGIYDERMREAEEVDCGLSWKKGGRTVWFEPKSVVVYDYPRRVKDPQDIGLFMWRWDMRAIIPDYKVFRQKWGIDMTESGSFKGFLVYVNGALGWLPRVWPSRTALLVDHAFARMTWIPRIPLIVWRRLRAQWLGYDDWVKELE